MNTPISITDTLFATVISGNNTIANLTISGIESVTELLRSVCSKLAGVAGLVTIDIRNTSMGWSQRRQLRLVPQVQQMQQVQPMQLTLF